MQYCSLQYQTLLPSPATSTTQWTWVWVNSGRWWWTGRPGVLQFMGSQRVRHDWATELNWTDAILFFTASDFTSITSPIHSWGLFLLWLRLFILSGVISPLISSSMLGTYPPGEFIFQCLIFLPFHTVHGVFKARILSGLPFPSPVDHILSDLSTMTLPSWVAPHSMA